MSKKKKKKEEKKERNKQTNTLKLKKKCIGGCCEDKSLVGKIDIVIFLSYFVEKLFLNFMFKCISIGARL